MERRRILSGSINGRLIKVAATATPGTLIHETPPVSGKGSVLYLFAVNSSASPVDLTIEFGGFDSPDDTITATIPATSGMVEVVVVPGFPLEDGLAVRAFAADADVVMIGGYAQLVASR